MPITSQRGRKDHYLPRGYLRGFIDPANKDLAKPFWHFDIESATWTMESPGSVGWERGMYDYHPGTNVLEHPDATFERFEREFPLVREHLLRRNFKGWVRQHRSFLLEYAQMMRARSPLFLQQQTAQNENTQVMTVTSVGPGNQVTVDTLNPYPPSAHFIRNRTITAMREEIQKGVDWMENFNWCLRYTHNVADPFVTGTQPITVEGRYPNSDDAPVLEEALKDRNTIIWFPLCWQACLVGAIDRFDEGTAEAEPSLISHVRGMFRRPSIGYVISPSRIEPF
jgi:hypothetical protein